jgi:hypothetical protein
MALIRPSLFLNFADSQTLDPRVTFSRASAGCYADKLGVLRYRPASTPRFWNNPTDGSPLGLMLEAAATNLLLWSEAFDNAAWTKTGSTVTANTSTAPDGNATADLVTAIDATSAVSQAVSVPANNGVAYSVFARAGASNFVSLSLNDGTNLVSAWFNLATGVTGSNLPGAGTLVFQASSIEAWGGGWYRCGVQAMGSTITTVTASLSPCAADGAAPAAGNAVNAWGAMLSAEGTNPNISRQSSYVGTTSAAVTRAADNAVLPYSKIDASAFNPNEGTYFVDFIVPPGSWTSWYGPGFGFVSSNTGSDYCLTGLTIGYPALGAMALAVQTQLWAGGASQGVASAFPSFAFGTPVKVAASYSRTDLLRQSVNGGAVTSAASIPAAMPPLPLNFTFELFAAWTVASAVSSLLTRRFSYFPRYLSADQMQQLTA